MALYTRRELTERCAEAGVVVSTWSPGDGVTRYRFASPTDGRGDYFGAGHPYYTALGLAEACVFARGLFVGLGLRG